MIRMILLGAPGSGKGTQAQRLKAKYGVPQISSGDLLRDAVARGTELGLQAKAAMNSGQLVSDDIVLGLIRERLSAPDAANGFVLDGFPRNIEQADALDRMLEGIKQRLDAVLLLDVRPQILMRRLAGRRTCPNCGAVYNVFFSPPAAENRCDRCNHPELVQRPDDRDEVIAKRLEVYQAQTRPLVEHYKKKGLLRVVAGEGPLDEVFARMESAALHTLKSDSAKLAGKIEVKASSGKRSLTKSGTVRASSVAKKKGKQTKTAAKQRRMPAKTAKTAKAAKPVKKKTRKTAAKKPRSGKTPQLQKKTAKAAKSVKKAVTRFAKAVRKKFAKATKPKARKKK